MDEFEEEFAFVPVDEADYLHAMHEGDDLPNSVSAQNIDRNSRLADATPNIKFSPVAEHDFPMIVFRCVNPVATIVVSNDLQSERDKRAGGQAGMEYARN